MFRALWTSASGMTAQQTNLDLILKKANTSSEKFRKAGNPLRKRSWQGEGL